MSHADRRALLIGVAAASLSLAGAAEAQTRRRSNPPQPPTSGHDMSNMDHMHMGPEFALTAKESIAVRALADCTVAGEACLSHCLDSLSTGDTMMAACARSVRDTLAVCRVTQTLVETHSSFAGQQLALCRDVCNACRTACAPHVEHSATCRACADSCAAVIAAIDALLA